MSLSSQSRTARHEIFMAREALHRFALTLCVTAMTLFTTQAFAHHGWAWAEEEQSELKGTIAEISMAPPHPALRVKAEDGRIWQVDLGNPNQTKRSATQRHQRQAIRPPASTDQLHHSHHAQHAQ